jgi:hypothetical protein
MTDLGAHVEARVAPDGRIVALADLAGDSPRPVEPDSPDGIAMLTRGIGVVYRFDNDESLRDLPYPEVLDAMRRALLLAAHKAGHGEMLDEPEALPEIRRLLRGVEEAARRFPRPDGRGEPDGGFSARPPDRAGTPRDR